MFEDLRSSADFFEEISSETAAPKAQGAKKAATTSRKSKPRQFLGMTAPQRFVVALFLFFLVLTLGTFTLILFEKVMLPL